MPWRTRSGVNGERQGPVRQQVFGEVAAEHANGVRIQTSSALERWNAKAQSRLTCQRWEPRQGPAERLNSRRGLPGISDESRSAAAKIAVASSWPESMPRLCCVGRRIHLRDAVVEFEPAAAVIGGEAAARRCGRGFTEGFACERSSHGSRLTRQPVMPLKGSIVAAVCSPRQVAAPEGYSGTSEDMTVSGAGHPGGDPVMASIVWRLGLRLFPAGQVDAYGAAATRDGGALVFPTCGSRLESIVAVANQARALTTRCP